MTTDGHDRSSTPQRRKSDLRRFESWKAIAAYMNRSVRTVRRWEASQGLPVHRLRHNTGCSVFAYQVELDAWRLENQSSYEESPVATATDSTPAPGRLRVRNVHAAWLIAAVLCGIAADRLLQFAPAGEPLGGLPIEEAAYWPESAAQVLVSPIFKSWSRGAITTADRHGKALERRLDELPDAVRVQVIDYLVEFELMLGRIASARQLTNRLPAGTTRSMLDTRIAFAAGDMSRVHEVLAGTAPDTQHDIRASISAAMDSLSADDAPTAQAQLEAVTAVLTPDDQGYFFVALDLLAKAHAAQDRMDQAVAVLERTMPHRDAAAHRRSGLFWLLCQRQLATLYRGAGRVADAERIEKQLRAYLKHADAEFPLLKTLS